jgi:hypothetical protein
VEAEEEGKEDETAKGHEKEEEKQGEVEIITKFVIASGRGS